MLLFLLVILYLFDFIDVLHSLPLTRGGLGWGIRVGSMGRINVAYIAWANAMGLVASTPSLRAVGRNFYR